jgi:hypothetical protein
MLMPLVFKTKSGGRLQKLLPYWPLAACIFLLLFIFFLLLPCLFRPWTRYPEILRAKIAWRSFQASFVGSCREDCLAARQTYASFWRPFFKNNPELAEKNYRAAIGVGNRELSTALIKIMAADYGAQSLPPLLAEIIADPGANAEDKRLIVAFFPEAFRDEEWLEQLRARILDEDLDLNDRVYALRLLSSFPEAENAHLLKDVVIRTTEPDLLRLAVQSLSTWPPDNFFWLDTELEALKKIIVNSVKGPLRWQRLWLLSTAAEHSDVISPVLTALVNDSNLDVISRGLAAESLRLIFKLDIKTPDPSSQDWQEFYESL